MVKKSAAKENFQSGQAVLIVLLITMVILTIGLSVVSRSVTDVRISAQSQESARAFWIAQGGLEKAVKARMASDSNTIGDISYQVTKIVSAPLDYYIFPELISQAEKMTFWLVNYDNPASFYDGNNLTVCWGNSGEPLDQPTTPALEANLVYRDNQAVPKYYSRRYPFDPNSVRRLSTNFKAADVTGCSLGGKSFAFKAVIPDDIADFTALPQFYRPIFLDLKLMFNTNPQLLGVRVASGKTVFSQQDTYESTAVVAGSNITRKLKETVLWPRIPEIFDYLVFSGGNL